MPESSRVSESRTGGHPQYAWGLGYSLLAFTALGWGFNFPILKLGLEHSPPLIYTMLRIALGTLTMFLLAAAMGNLRLPHRKDIPVVLSVGLLQNLGFITLVTVALQYLPAGRAVILAYTSPIWVVPAAALFLGERFTLPKAIGVGLGMSGLVSIMNPLSVAWDESGLAIGAGLILLATFIWTAGLVHVRRHHWHGDVWSLIPWQIGCSLMALIPVALLSEDFSAVQWDTSFVLNITFSGAIASGLCVAAQVGAMRSLPAVSMSLSSAAVPTVGMLASFWVLGEQPLMNDIIGFVLIALGIAVVGLADRRQARMARANALTAL